MMTTLTMQTRMMRMRTRMMKMWMWMRMRMRMMMMMGIRRKLRTGRRRVEGDSLLRVWGVISPQSASNNSRLSSELKIWRLDRVLFIIAGVIWQSYGYILEF
uniref:Uncharacterized protein n=1 Tax=Opuntia streptacantha TaxID=393608 RepID=A0A7C8YKR4_OPUST